MYVYHIIFHWYHSHKLSSSCFWALEDLKVKKKIKKNSTIVSHNGHFGFSLAAALWRDSDNTNGFLTVLGVHSCKRFCACVRKVMACWSLCLKLATKHFQTWISLSNLNLLIWFLVLNCSTLNNLSNSAKINQFWGSWKEKRSRKGGLAARVSAET